MNYIPIEIILLNLKPIHNGIFIPDNLLPETYLFSKELLTNLTNVLHGFLDSSEFLWSYNESRKSYYLDNYNLQEKKEENLFNDSSLYLFIDGARDYFFLPKEHEFIADRWTHVSTAWKTFNLGENNDFIFYVYPLFCIDYNLNLLCNNILVDNGWVFEYYPLKDSIYEKNFLTERQSSHHDFVVGQHIILLEWWNNPLVNKTVNKNILGWHIFWYERFGSIEFFLKMAYTEWVELTYYLWQDSLIISNTREIFNYTTFNQSHFVVKNKDWIRGVNDAKIYHWPNKDFMFKGINMYAIDEKYVELDKQDRVKKSNWIW